MRKMLGLQLNEEKKKNMTDDSKTVWQSSLTIKRNMAYIPDTMTTTNAQIE
jgi:hypothetical protein